MKIQHYLSFFITLALSRRSESFAIQEPSIARELSPQKSSRRTIKQSRLPQAVNTLEQTYAKRADSLIASYGDTADTTPLLLTLGSFIVELTAINPDSIILSELKERAASVKLQENSGFGQPHYLKNIMFDDEEYSLAHKLSFTDSLIDASLAYQLTTISPIKISNALAILELLIPDKEIRKTKILYSIHLFLQKNLHVIDTIEFLYKAIPENYFEQWFLKNEKAYPTIILEAIQAFPACDTAQELNQRLALTKRFFSAFGVPTRIIIAELFKGEKPVAGIKTFVRQIANSHYDYYTSRYPINIDRVNTSEGFTITTTDAYDMLYDLFVNHSFLELDSLINDTDNTSYLMGPDTFSSLTKLYNHHSHDNFLKHLISEFVTRNNNSVKSMIIELDFLFQIIQTFSISWSKPMNFLEKTLESKQFNNSLEVFNGLYRMYPLRQASLFLLSNHADITARRSYNSLTARQHFNENMPTHIFKSNINNFVPSIFYASNTLYFYGQTNSAILTFMRQRTNLYSIRSLYKHFDPQTTNAWLQHTVLELVSQSGISTLPTYIYLYLSITNDLGISNNRALTELSKLTIRNANNKSDIKFKQYSALFHDLLNSAISKNDTASSNSNSYRPKQTLSSPNRLNQNILALLFTLITLICIKAYKERPAKKIKQPKKSSSPTHKEDIKHRQRQLTHENRNSTIRLKKRRSSRPQSAKKLLRQNIIKKLVAFSHKKSALISELANNNITPAQLKSTNTDYLKEACDAKNNIKELTKQLNKLKHSSKTKSKLLSISPKELIKKQTQLETSITGMKRHIETLEAKREQIENMLEVLDNKNKPIPSTLNSYLEGYKIHP